MTAAYSTLNRTQKLAAFLILLGPESAGELLRHFNSEQLESVAREMVAARFDWRHIANDVERLYDQVLA